MKLYNFNEKKEEQTHHVTMKPNVTNEDLVRLITIVHSENMAILRILMNAVGFPQGSFENMEQAYIDEIQKILE